MLKNHAVLLFCFQKSLFLQSFRNKMTEVNAEQILKFPDLIAEL